ncbi:MAG: T9SS type A sorting domain-containing protein, partial [Ignavibacteriaceae bacterium]|nr:T9SS type A sorting domain-containing protein [Ignavibacteriaceae bacterium]
PPAIGYKLLQGPIVETSPVDSAKFNNIWLKGFRNLKMTAFYYPPIRPPVCGMITGGEVEFYNFLRGLFWNGEHFIDPSTQEVTTYFFSGDPVNGTGWADSSIYGYWYLCPEHPTFISNRTFLLSSGPFNFAPGDTQEVTIGILISRGESNIQSVAELKKDAAKLQLFYDAYKPEIPEPIIEPPGFYSLTQNYPNPFNPVTTIKYTIPVASLVTLKVYDILGNEISTLVNEVQEADEYSVKFNSDGLASGIYIYTISAREFTRTKKMVVLR